MGPRARGAHARRRAAGQGGGGNRRADAGAGGAARRAAERKRELPVRAQPDLARRRRHAGRAGVEPGQRGRQPARACRVPGGCLPGSLGSRSPRTSPAWRFSSSVATPRPSRATTPPNGSRPGGFTAAPIAGWRRSWPPGASRARHSSPSARAGGRQRAPRREGAARGRRNRRHARAPGALPPARGGADPGWRRRRRRRGRAHRPQSQSGRRRAHPATRDTGADRPAPRPPLPARRGRRARRRRDGRRDGAPDVAIRLLIADRGLRRDERYSGRGRRLRE